MQTTERIKEREASLSMERVQPGRKNTWRTNALPCCFGSSSTGNPFGQDDKSKLELKGHCLLLFSSAGHLSTTGTEYWKVILSCHWKLLPLQEPVHSLASRPCRLLTLQMIGFPTVCFPSQPFIMPSIKG